jgi:hypothetical protein
MPPLADASLPLLCFRCDPHSATWALRQEWNRTIVVTKRSTVAPSERRTGLQIHPTGRQPAIEKMAARANEDEEMFAPLPEFHGQRTVVATTSPPCSLARILLSSFLIVHAVFSLAPGRKKRAGRRPSTSTIFMLLYSRMYLRKPSVGHRPPSPPSHPWSSRFHHLDLCEEFVFEP